MMQTAFGLQSVGLTQITITLLLSSLIPSWAHMAVSPLWYGPEKTPMASSWVDYPSDQAWPLLKHQLNLSVPVWG